jgi:hypothetical protein
LIFSGFFLPSLQFEILNSNVNIPEIGHWHQFYRKNGRLLFLSATRRDFVFFILSGLADAHRATSPSHPMP